MEARAQATALPRGPARPTASSGGDVGLPLGISVVVVTIGGAVLGVDEQVATSQRIDGHVHNARQGHQTPGDTEVGLAGGISLRGGHTARGER